MKLNDAYEHLGLTPLEEHLEAHGDRGAGATTWMLVTAAIEALEGGQVTIVGSSLDYAEKLARDCLSFVNKLGSSTYVHRKRDRCWELGTPGAGIIRWASYRSPPKAGDRTTQYRDDQWATRLRLRREGPYAEIRLIRRTVEGGKYRYRAYDGWQEFLLELDEAGANAIVDADPYRVAKEGW